MMSWMSLVQVCRELEVLGLPYTMNSLHRLGFMCDVPCGASLPSTMVQLRVTGRKASVCAHVCFL